MVSSENQDLLKEWLCSRIGLVPTKDIQLIGSIEGGIIRGVVGFDGYNGASITMHVAGEPGWLTRDLIWACFDYPFNRCGVNVILGVVPSGNKDALRFNKHLGFKLRLEIEGAHPDGSLIVMTMTRGECRYLNRKRHGQEIRAATGP